jgi:glutamate/tyrosine decarboxylase-like PLP-dependent enzyme
MDKAANLLVLSMYKYAVEEDTRALNANFIEKAIHQAKIDGKKHFIVVCNMMTTMFGSVDDVVLLTDVLKTNHCSFKLHIDGAYGGFYYPFAAEISDLTFENQDISSFTLDAHKMAQAPYGTGIFLIRKGFIHYANTKEASYVEGEDYTLIGSRSGANAVAVWMILSTYGPHGWFEKVLVLQKRTEWLAQQLQHLEIPCFRNPYSNILTIRAEFIAITVAEQFGLVPDNHHHPTWYKVVVMDHVTMEKLELLVQGIVSSTEATV